MTYVLLHLLLLHMTYVVQRKLYIITINQQYSLDDHKIINFIAI